MDNLSAMYFNADKVFPAPAKAVTSGYDQIPKTFMKSAISAGAALVLNFLVTSISQNSTSVTVTGKQSDGSSKTYIADYVILTVPLGVLKAGSITFSPSLSAQKQAAIAKLGFGTIVKVIFFYNKPFWDTASGKYYLEASNLPDNRGRYVASGICDP